MSTLDEVYDAIAGDWWWEHLRRPGIRLVHGYGCAEPKVLLIGEAPGAVENHRGRPFCGPSGAVLDHLGKIAGIYLDDCGINRVNANAFVTNTVKYRPDGNATPGLPDILHAREGFKQRRMTAGFQEVVDETWPEGAGSLREEWAALGGPPVIVCVGSVAHTAISPVGYESVGRHVGRPYQQKGTWIISQFHPAYGLHPKNPERRQRIQEEMTRQWQKMGEFLDKEGLL